MSRSKRSRWQISEQKQRFAIRKFSQGVFSVLIGTMFILGTPVIAQGDEISNLDVGVKKKDHYQIRYQNVTEDSLTPEQKSKIVHDRLPKDLVGSDQVYYLVYRTAKGTALPQTGEFTWELDKFLVGSGLLIAALGMLPKRARRYRFLTAIIVTSNTASLGTSIGASANINELSKNDRTYLVAKGESLPEISTQIPGHEYVGYLLISDIKHSIPSISSNDQTTTEMELKRTSDNEKTTTSLENTKEAIAYETRYVDDPDLELGKTKVKVAGQPGERTIVYEVKQDATGKELSREEKSNTVTKEPVTEVIVRGTKALNPSPEETVSEESKVESIPYEIEYVDDPDLELGKTKVKVVGQAGERTIVYEVKRDATGKELSREEKSNTVTKEPVIEVIVRGTKVLDSSPEETVSEESKVESIPYGTEYVDDPELELGKTKVKVAGQPGERTIVYEVKQDATGKELSREEKSNTV
ncbi:G5 domain-containing protein, partial [uncultured Ligilactobacillus sp.]